MRQVQKSELIPFAVVLLVFSALSVFAQAEKINIFKGNVSIGGSSSASNGAVAEAFIGSASSSAKNYTIGSLPSSSGEYVLDFSCDSGSTAFLKVWGINATWQTCANTLINFTNLTVSLVADDSSCSYANACSSLFCCSSNTAINASGGSGTCQAAVCGTGISIPGFAINSTSIINTQTVNFTINISSVLRYNITAANFTLVTPTSVLSTNFTIPSNSRNLNISYQIFASAETAVPGTYNITAVQVNDNGSITNRTTVTTLNFTVASRLTVPSFAINSTSIINTQTVNFTVNLNNTYYNITAANFTLVTPTSVLSTNFTIPSNSRNLNISYQIFASAETAVPGTYNITAVQVNDNGSITNRTTVTTLNFTVASRLTVPNFALSAASITTAQTVNFTINLSDTYYNITAANFTLVTGTTVVSRNFTIPSNGRNLNISYKIFASSETASVGTYNVTAVQVNDNGSIVNRTAITNMNFTVTAVAAVVPDAGGAGAGTGAGGGGVAPAPAAPSQETIDVVKEALPEAFKEAVAAGNVEIKTVAAPEVKEVPVAAETVTKTLEQLETIVKTEEAKQALSAIQEAVSSGGATTVSVKKTIEVVKATNKVTKEEVVVSVVKLSVTAPGNQDLKNVEVVEVIPKAVASTVNAVTFKGEKPVVLEADPIVKWFFAQVSKGTTKDMSYAVKDDIRSIGTKTVGVQGRAEAAPAAPEVPPPPAAEEKGAPAPVEVKKPTPLNTIIMVVVLAVVVVAGWLFLKSRKKVMK